MRFIRHPTEDTPRGHTKDAIERMILSRGYKIGQKLPTYRELAAHFGIAVRTIERVMRHLADEGTVQLLHGKGAFIRKLPSGSGKLGEIGLVYPASRMHLLQTNYLNQILVGVIAASDIEQIDVQIVALRATSKDTVPVPARDIVLRVDGIILLGVVNEQYIAEFTREAVPLVLADGQTAEPIHCISVDNTQAVDLAMDHLHSLGHRRIAYVDAQSKDDLASPDQPTWIDSFDTHERREAYLAALSRLGLDYRRSFPSIDDDPTRLETAVAGLRRDRDRPSAILTYDDSTAVHLARALSRLGLRVPDDISVAAAVGSAGSPGVEGHLLTCSIAAFQDMGWKAVEALRRQATGRRAAKHRLERIACALQVGTSTAAPQH